MHFCLHRITNNVAFAKTSEGTLLVFSNSTDTEPMVSNMHHLRVCILCPQKSNFSCLEMFRRDRKACSTDDMSSKQVLVFKLELGTVAGFCLWQLDRRAPIHRAPLHIDVPLYI